MTTIPLTSMAHATSLTGAEILYAQQGGTDVQLTAAQIQAFIGAAKALQTYFSFDTQDDEPLLVPGSPGAPGATGAQGPTGAIGQSIYEAPETDEPYPIPGPPGTPGAIGAQGLTGGLGPAVYLEAPDADEPPFVPGTQGAPGVAGPIGAQGAIGPVYLEAYEADEPFPIPGQTGQPGPQGTPGTTGAQGASGPIWLEVFDADEPPIIPGQIGPPGAPGGTGPAGPQGATAYLEGQDGEEGTPGPPGVAGAPGAQGAPGNTGAQGPIGPPVYLEAPEPDEPVMIPGVLPGPQGNPGQTGSQGPIGPPVYLDAEPADEPVMFPGVAGATGAQGTPGTTGAQGPIGPAVYLEAPEADEPLTVPGTQGAAGAPGTPGTTGSQGPIGPPVYLEAAEADEPMIQPGPAGLAGPTGAQGIQGRDGPAVILDMLEPDEPIMFPGVAGPTGPVGTGLPGAVLMATVAAPTATVSATYVMAGLNQQITPKGTGELLVTITGLMSNASAIANAAAVYIAWGTGTPPVNGAAAVGTDLTGAQIASFPTSAGYDVPFAMTGVVTGLNLGQSYWFDLAWHSDGTHSVAIQNATICIVEQGGQGLGNIAGGAHLTLVEPDDAIENPMLGVPTPAQSGWVAGALAANTTINDTITLTTGGVTFAAPPIAKGQIYRVRAFGNFVAVSSATVRSGNAACFWGTTQLSILSGLTIAPSVAETTGWVLEFILIGTSTTAIWAAGNINTLMNQVNWIYTTSGSTAVTAGPQTLDLRFSMSVAVATDQWIVEQVTIERLQ